MGFPNGDIKISNNFELNIEKPIDSRIVVDTIADRDNISFKYVGLLVVVKANDVLYQCINKFGAGVWKNAGGDGGTVTSVGITSSDITVSSSPITTSGNITLTLPVVNPNVGTFNGITVNSKGQVTAAVATVIPNATSSVTGLLTSTDYNTFNNKVDRSGDTLTGPLILNADPTTPLGTATKQYVDALVGGLSWKDPVKAATTGNITLSGLQTIDGVSLVGGDRILVKNQTTPTENGIYIVNSSAWIRSTDTDTGTELKGATTNILQGTVNGSTQYTNNALGTITIGTTNITFSQIGATTAYSAGNGISITGNTIGFATPLTTKGQLLTRTASGYTALSVGADDQVLTADSTSITGFSYKTMTTVFTNDIVVSLSSGKTAGKYTTGQTIPLIGKTPQQAFNDIFVEYLNPFFNSFNNNQATQVEIGTTISGTRNFTWSINSGSGTISTINIIDVTASTTLLTSTPNDGSENGVAVTTLQLNTPFAQQKWRGVGNNTSPNGTFNSGDYTVTAYYLLFQGAVAANPTNSAGVRALPANQLYGGGTTFILNTGSTLIKFAVALPPGVNITSVVDLDALNAVITSQYINTGNISVLDAGGTSRTYSLWIMNIATPYSANHRHSITVS